MSEYMEMSCVSEAQKENMCKHRKLVPNRSRILEQSIMIVENVWLELQVLYFSYVFTVLREEYLSVALEKKCCFSFYLIESKFM